MSAVVLDRLFASGAVTLDRFVDISGVPTITSLGTARDGATLAINGTGFDASGNTAWLVQNDSLIQLPVGSEGITLITTSALDTSGIKITQPVSIYVLNSTGVQSNSVGVTILSAVGESAYVVSQQFLGDPSTRVSGTPDLSIFDEIRFKNPIGSTIGNLTMNSQGDLVAAPAMTSIDAAIQDGTGLSPYVTLPLTDPASTAIVAEVRGLSQTVANATELILGLTTSVQGFSQSTIYPPNTVSAQFPSAGIALALGGVVELTMSLGATGVLAPILTGVDRAIADGIRTAAGLIGVDYRYIDGLNSGLVLGQSVNPGTPMQVGDALDLVYSSNLEPNVVNLLMQNGIAILQSASLLVAPLLFAFSPKPVGTILAQSPVADSIVAPGDTVTLTVSLGGLTLSYLGVSGPEVSRNPGFGTGAKVGGSGVSGATVSATQNSDTGTQPSWTADSSQTVDTNKYLADGRVLH